MAEHFQYDSDIARGTSILVERNNNDEVHDGSNFEEHFIIDKVIGKRFNKKTRKNEYQVLWKPIAENEASDISLVEYGRLYKQIPNSLNRKNVDIFSDEFWTYENYIGNNLYVGNARVTDKYSGPLMKSVEESQSSYAIKKRKTSSGESKLKKVIKKGEISSGSNSHLTCNVCGFQARRTNNLEEHARTHSNKSFFCSNCDFQTKNYLSFCRHCKKHGNEERTGKTNHQKGKQTQTQKTKTGQNHVIITSNQPPSVDLVQDENSNVAVRKTINGDTDSKMTKEEIMILDDNLLIPESTATLLLSVNYCHQSKTQSYSSNSKKNMMISSTNKRKKSRGTITDEGRKTATDRPVTTCNSSSSGKVVGISDILYFWFRPKCKRKKAPRFITEEGRKRAFHKPISSFQSKLMTIPLTNLPGNCSDEARKKRIDNRRKILIKRRAENEISTTHFIESIIKNASGWGIDDGERKF